MAGDEPTSTPTPEGDFKVTTAEMEAARRAQWKGAIQQELQMLVQEAAGIREKINTAKTQYKKTFYQKKFAKIQPRVMQMVAALQRLEVQDAAKKQMTEHVHDENCQHDHHEDQKEEPANVEPSETE